MTISVALVVPTWLFLVDPRTEGPAHADAVFVLGGDQESQRVALGSQLVERGFAPALVLSWKRSDRSCTPSTPVPAAEVTCVRPTPFTTQGEARLIRRLATVDHWSHVLVVVSDDQATRARVRIRRCYAGGLTLMAVRPPVRDLPWRIAYETSAIVKAEVLQRTC